MKNVPSHHHAEVLIAMRMASILAQAGLVSPATDIAIGELDVIDWAAQFVTEHGVALDVSAGQPMLKEYVLKKAMFQGWMLREVRDTRHEPPADFYFKQQVAAVQEIQKIPAHVPRSCAHQALVDQVVRELQRRALHSLRMGGVHKKGEMSFETDGRFEKLKVHGIPVATCGVGERDTGQWIAALESNLGIQVKPEKAHQVLVEIDGRDVSCGSANVRVQIFNDRLVDEDDQPRSMLYNFTSEGVITECQDTEGNLLASTSAMYDEVVDDLVNDEEPAPGER